MGGSFPCIKAPWESLRNPIDSGSFCHAGSTVFFFYIPVVHRPLSINRHFLRKFHLYIGIMPKWSIVSFEGNSWLWTNWKGDPFCEKIVGTRPFSNFPRFSNWFYRKRTCPKSGNLPNSSFNMSTKKEHKTLISFGRQRQSLTSDSNLGRSSNWLHPPKPWGESSSQNLWRQMCGLAFWVLFFLMLKAHSVHIIEIEHL